LEEVEITRCKVSVYTNRTLAGQNIVKKSDDESHEPMLYIHESIEIDCLPMISSTTAASSKLIDDDDVFI
jgi:hypothetical protein